MCVSVRTCVTPTLPNTEGNRLTSSPNPSTGDKSRSQGRLLSSGGVPSDPVREKESSREKKKGCWDIPTMTIRKIKYPFYVPSLFNTERLQVCRSFTYR